MKSGQEGLGVLLTNGMESRIMGLRMGVGGLGSGISSWQDVIAPHFLWVPCFFSDTKGVSICISK